VQVLKIDPIEPEIQSLQIAADLLKKNQVIVHPTETVYGLAGNYSSDRVIQKVMEIKGRKTTQPFSILVDNIATILELSGNDDEWLEGFLTQILPDAITVLVPRKRKLEFSFWNQFSHLGFRFPQHSISTSLVKLSGTPLITTSANLSGEKFPPSINEISREILDCVFLVLDAGETIYKIPSTIIKISDKEPDIELIREGAVAFEKIKNCLEK
jgi:L-threonylcarbamoyladenylate synthase